MMPWLLLVACWLSGPTVAQQLSFSAAKASGQHSYHYVWRDAAGNTKTVEFHLDGAVVSTLPFAQPPYSPRLAAEQVRLGLLTYAQTFDPRLARIEITQGFEQLSIQVQGKNAQAVKDIQQQLSQQQQTLTADFIRSRMYRFFNDHQGNMGIIPDYPQHVLQHASALRPAAQAFYDLLPGESDARAHINLLLTWVQSIPYNTLEDRGSSDGSGFLPPLGLLAQNQGDCDSKAVLTAALIRGFLPQTPMAMVLLPQHAMLAIAMPPLPNDITVASGTQNWVVFDPTGPALQPVGQISEKNRLALLNQQFQLLPIPGLAAPSQP